MSEGLGFIPCPNSCLHLSANQILKGSSDGSSSWVSCYPDMRPGFCSCLLPLAGPVLAIIVGMKGANWQIGAHSLSKKRYMYVKAQVWKKKKNTFKDISKTIQLIRDTSLSIQKRFLRKDIKSMTHKRKKTSKLDFDQN